MPWLQYSTVQYSTVQYSTTQYLVAVLVLAAAVPARGRVVEGAWHEAEAGPERVVRAEAAGGAGRGEEGVAEDGLVRVPAGGGGQQPPVVGHQGPQAARPGDQGVPGPGPGACS